MKFLSYQILLHAFYHWMNRKNVRFFLRESAKRIIASWPMTIDNCLEALLPLENNKKRNEKENYQQISDSDYKMKKESISNTMEIIIQEIWKFTPANKAIGKAKLTYKVTKYPKKAKKCMTVTKSGKVTLKKKAKKGTYKIRITAAKTSKYQKAVKYVTVKVK